MKLLAVVILLSAFTSLAVMEVVRSFKRMCPQFFINRQTPTVPKWDHQKQICQKWQSRYHYATLYDIKLRIPVYSAYTFTQEVQTKRKVEWKNEPQLENKTQYNRDMEYITDNNTLEKLINQAIDNDYRKKPHTRETEYTRGHVFPNQYAQDQVQADSTFTLTNIAPQTNKSNLDWATQVETPMLKVIKQNCTLRLKSPAYIVTGVVPGNRWIEIERGGKTYKEGVNIPSYYWTAFCCKGKKQNWVSRAYLAEQNDKDNNDPPAVQMTVTKFNKKLTKLYNTKDFKVFGDEC